MGTIGIIGSTGAMGKALAARLRSEGRPYVAIGRDRQRVEALFGHDALATCRTWDTETAESLQPALAGVESVIYAIGVDYWKFVLHPQLMQRVLDEPRAYGRFWNYAGAEPIKQRAFADAIYAQCGTKARYIVATKMLLRLLGLFDPITRELVEMN
jgi:uncharacterized protein YbjT (DUF2867 family)